VYQLKGESVPLSWSYNLDGKVINEREWTFNIDQRIATVLSSGAVDIDPAYTSRVQVSGNILRLLNIQEKDSGNYVFRVQFTTFDPRWIIDQAELIVVGKFPYLYPSLHVYIHTVSVTEKLQMSLNSVRLCFSLTQPLLGLWLQQTYNTCSTYMNMYSLTNPDC